MSDDSRQDPAPTGNALVDAMAERESAARSLVEIGAEQEHASATFERLLHKERSKQRRLQRIGEDPTDALGPDELASMLQEQRATRIELENRLRDIEARLEEALSRYGDALENERFAREGMVQLTDRAGEDNRDRLVEAEELAGYSHFRRFTTTLVRHSATYASGSAFAYGLAFIQALILIQYLDPTAFGQVAIISVTASFASLALTLLYRRGTTSRTFGTQVDEDDDADEQEELESAAALTSRDPRRALGTGLILIFGTGFVVIGVLAVVGLLLPPQTNLPGAVQHLWLALGGVIGALTALWDTLLRLPYIGRKPWSVVAMTAIRPIVTFGLSVWLVVIGKGVPGVIIGQVAGTALALGGALFTYRAFYRLRFLRSEVSPIMSLSRERWARSASMWWLQNGDTLILATVAPAATVGFYRLASRLTMPISFPTGAFFTAWLPLERSPTMLAAQQLRGRQPLRSIVITYLAMILTLSLLLLFALVEFIERVLPAAYQEAVHLLPWLVGVTLAQVFLHITHRFGRMANRRVVYNWTLVICAAISVPITIAGAVLAGAEGAAAANITATLLGAGYLWWRSQTGPAPLPVQWGRILATVGIGLASVAFALGAGALLPIETGWFAVVAFICFVPLLVLLAVVPREHRRSFRRVRDELRPRRRGDTEIVTRIETLTLQQREILRRALEDSSGVVDPESSDAFITLSASKVQMDGLRVLRVCTETKPRTEPLENAIASYLFVDSNFLEKHHAVRALFAQRVRPNEIAILERWREDLRRVIRL